LEYVNEHGVELDGGRECKRYVECGRRAVWGVF